MVPTSAKKLESLRGRSMSSRADIIFNAHRCYKTIKKTTRHRVQKEAGIYMATVLEYLVAEILEVAGDVTRQNNKRRITPRTIMLSVRSDEELNALTENVDFPEAGAIPYIQPVLLKKDPKSRKRRVKQDSENETHDESDSQ